MRELLEMTLEGAQIRKWNEGRERFGPEWQGDLPILEAYSEVLDLLNYLDRHLQDDPYDSAVRHLRLGIFRAAVELAHRGRRALRDDPHNQPETERTE